MYSVVFLLFTFIFGLIIGSFLNVLIYRLHTGKSLGGQSHCLSCAQPLSWYELVPVFSYVALRGRCRTCGSFIPLRYLWVELTTGLLFVAAAVSLPLHFWWAAFLVVSILVVITVYDLRHLIIPNGLVLVLSAVAVSYRLHEGYLLGDYFTIIKEAALSAAVAGLPLLFIVGISRGRWMGLGDPKLAFVLGLFLTWTQSLSLLLLSFWSGAALTLLFLGGQRIVKAGKKRLLFSRRQLTMRSEVPFAPFLVLSFLLVWFSGIGITDILNIFNYVTWY